MNSEQVSSQEFMRTLYIAQARNICLIKACLNETYLIETYLMKACLIKDV